MSNALSMEETLRRQVIRDNAEILTLRAELAEMKVAFSIAEQRAADVETQMEEWREILQEVWDNFHWENDEQHGVMQRIYFALADTKEA